MKRKFLPVNTTNEMVIDKKRILNIITYDQLKQINGIASNNNSNNHGNQFNSKAIKKGRVQALCFTQKKGNTSYSNPTSTSPINQSFSSSSQFKDNKFPSLYTDKLNFRCAFSNVGKNTSNDIIGNKITKEFKSKRNTFNCSAFPILNNIKDSSNSSYNNSSSNQQEGEKSTPKFCQTFFTSIY